MCWRLDPQGSLAGVQQQECENLKVIGNYALGGNLRTLAPTPTHEANVLFPTVAIHTSQ